MPISLNNYPEIDNKRRILWKNVEKNIQIGKTGEKNTDEEI